MLAWLYEAKRLFEEAEERLASGTVLPAPSSLAAVPSLHGMLMVRCSGMPDAAEIGDVGGGHEFLFLCPDDEDRAGEGALLVGPDEQLLGFGEGAGVLGDVATDLGVVAQRTDLAPEHVVGDPPLGQGAKDHGEMADPAWAQQLGDQEGAAGERRSGAQQPARWPGRGVVEGLAGNEDEVGNTIGAAGADDELCAAPVVADECDLVQVQSGEQLRERRGQRREGEVGAVGHRRGVRAERQLRDDEAVAISWPGGDGVPQGAVHQHPVQHHHCQPAATGVNEMVGNRCPRRSWRRTGIIGGQVTLL